MYQATVALHVSPHLPLFKPSAWEYITNNTFLAKAYNVHALLLALFVSLTHTCTFMNTKFITNTHQWFHSHTLSHSCTIPIARSLYLILGVYFMLVAVKLSVWLAADRSRESAQSKDIVPPLCLSCNWTALSLPDKTKAVCRPLITSADWRRKPWMTLKHGQ